MKHHLLLALLLAFTAGCHKHSTGGRTPPPTPPPAPPAVITCSTEVCRISCAVPVGIRGELNLVGESGERFEVVARERLVSADILTLELPLELSMLRCTNTVDGITETSEAAGPFKRTTQ